MTAVAPLPGRARWALAGLAAILLISAGWWALALWPLPAETPGWLLRTREVCFGSTRDGLPHAGGWVLLVGEPAGMLLFLFAAWGQEVRDGLAALRRRWTGRLLLGGAGLGLAAGLLLATLRVADARGMRFDPQGGTGRAAPLVELSGRTPALDLVDQHGAAVTLERFRGRPVLVTFAFAHCETICPLLVRQALMAAAEAPRVRPAVLVVTLDPWRDTPGRLGAMAAAWQLPEGAHVLGGEVDRVERTLNAWKVPRVRNEVTGDLMHPALTYVLTPDGRLAYLTDGRPEALLQALSRM